MSAAANRKPPILGPKQRTDEWYSLRLYDPDRTERPVMFGGSEASMVMENPLELFLIKSRRKAPPEVTEDMEVGALMEPVVIEMHRRRAGIEIETDISIGFHPEHSFMAASPDGIASDGDLEWGVDAKTSTDRMFQRESLDAYKYGQEGTDNVPLWVLWQMQQTCEVWNFPYIDIPVLFGRKYRAYRVFPDSGLIETLVAAEKELAERIINDDPPPPTWSHPRTRECLQALYGMEKGLVHPLSDMNFSRWCSVARRKNEIKILEEANAADINQILAEMGPAEYAALPHESAYLKRIQVRDSLWTDADVELARTSLGTVKRAGHVRLQQVKNAK